MSDGNSSTSLAQAVKSSKTFDVTTALAWVLPSAHCSTVNTIRSQYDRAFKRWGNPHINMIFPFVSVECFPEVQQRLQKEIQLQQFEQFEVVLDEVGWFSQGKGQLTVHLKPSNKSQFNKLFQLIRKAVPEAEYKHNQMEPHLTLAQCATGDLEQITQLIRKTISLPIVCKLETCNLSLLHRSKQNNDAPFEIYSTVNLCHKAAPAVSTAATAAATENFIDFM